MLAPVDVRHLAALHYGNAQRQYVTIKHKENGNVMSIIRLDFLSSGIVDVMDYAIRKNAEVYSARESDWDNAIAFDLCPCVEYNGKEFITIHEPDQGSL